MADRLQVDIKVPYDQVENTSFLEKKIIEKLGWHKTDLKDYLLVKRSIDARKRPAMFQLRYEIEGKGHLIQSSAFITHYKKVDPAKTVHIIGAGPAGYFAALTLLESGFKPIVIERGKNVRDRRRDLRAIQQFGEVNPNSNYCFGEGGAGTYSDGKLYTRSHKRGNIERILQILVEHGASRDILIDAHPHIGSNKLPGIVSALRNTIENQGGEVFFNTKLEGIDIREGKVKGLKLSDGRYLESELVILATGHSARDIYSMLYRKGVRLEAKDFALGVRIEHPQALIDEIQYGQNPRSENLPASSYQLVCQVGGTGVFSFCMCPGGLIVPAATAPGEIVVNGMSLSRRDSPFANAGTVTAVSESDFSDFKQFGVFAGLEFQRSVEQIMFNAGDGSQKAPAQILTDFVEGKVSNSVRDSSYIPGLFSAPVHALLPAQVYERLRSGVMEFGKRMKGYYTSEAQVVATESRTSAPVRIPRDDKSFMHPDVFGLFPCGEGAGFAGGILSAAMDGQRVAKIIVENKQ